MLINFCSGLKVLLIALYRSISEITLLVVLMLMAILILAPLVFYAGYFTAEQNFTASNTITSIPQGMLHVYTFTSYISQSCLERMIFSVLIVVV